MKYVWLKPHASGNAARFRHIKNFEDSFELLEGVPLTGSFPPDAEYRMNDEYPDRVALVDVLHNLDRQLIVHDRLKAWLDTQGVSRVEYLPINVVNHKGRKSREKYFIVNMLYHADCIDQQQTTFKWNSLDEEQMSDVEDLTIDEERVEPGSQLFRLKHLPGPIIAARSLVDQMLEAGFRGFSIEEISDYES